MQTITLGSTPLRECERCLGLWVDIASFERICADREEQAAVLGNVSQSFASAGQEKSKVSYAPCPECKQLMNRVNFARCSGVIVDICKGHGTWFDREELSRIVEFIRKGGLAVSREKEKAGLIEERQRLRQEQMSVDRNRALAYGLSDSEDNHRLIGIASASELLKLLVD